MYIRVVLETSLINLIIFIVIKIVTSEWIHLPQFSDESKVYRVPFIKSDRHKISFDRTFNIAKNILSNSTGNITDTIKEMMQMPLMVNDAITTLANTVMNTNDNGNNINGYTAIEKLMQISNHSISNNVTRNKNKLILSSMHTLMDYCNTSEIEKFSDNTTTVGAYKLNIFKSERMNEKGASLFQFLPIDLIKRVHTTLLKVTQTTIRDKLIFLRKFKESMLQKLKFRLIPFVYSVRRKRGSYWDDHDDHIGFPSLEGALLAISFLTFAVYLVQLIMMLLRNLAVNGNNTTGTVFVNRNRRSIQQLSDDSLRVLQYLDGFSNHY